jgi:hypothetical protein
LVGTIVDEGAAESFALEHGGLRARLIEQRRQRRAGLPRFTSRASIIAPVVDDVEPPR